MRVIVHIGYKNVGSSLIQAYCFNNAVTLRQAGLFYPLVGTHENTHHPFSKLVIGKPAGDKVVVPPGLMSALREEMTSCDCEQVLISSEYLVQAGSRQIKNIRNLLVKDLGATKFVIIVYLQRHDLWFESLFKDAVMTTDSPPWDLDIKDFTIHALGRFSHVSRYDVVLDRWAKVFGVGSIVARPFEQGQFVGGGLLTDFFAHVFPQHKIDGEPEGIGGNISISDQRLYTVGLLRRWPASPRRERAIAEILNGPEPSVSILPTQFAEFTVSQRRSLIESYKLDYAIVNKKFLNRLDGRLFLERV
jgi:hypothetical protein